MLFNFFSIRLLQHGANHHQLLWGQNPLSDICSHSKPKLQVGLWAKYCIKLYKILCNLKGQIPCGIFRKQNQIAFSSIEFPQTHVVTPAVICIYIYSILYFRSVTLLSTEKEAVAGRSGEYSFQPFLNSFQPFLNSFTLPGNTGRSFKSFM